MNYDIDESVYFILIPENHALRRSLYDEIEKTHEKVYVCDNLEDFIVKTSYFLGNADSFITYFIETTPAISGYIQESVLLKIGQPKFFPICAFLITPLDDSKEYIMPAHIENIRDHYKTVEVIDSEKIDLDDEYSKLKFFEKIRYDNNKMRFHLYGQIGSYILFNHVENNSQGITMLREDVASIVNPDVHSLDSIINKKTAIDFHKITTNLRDDLKENKYLTGGIDWMIAQFWVNRAKYLVSFLLALSTFGLYFSSDIYKFYYSIDFVFKNKYSLERVIKKETIKENTKLQKEIKK
jgi:hypothetical protein